MWDTCTSHGDGRRRIEFEMNRNLYLCSIKVICIWLWLLRSYTCHSWRYEDSEAQAPWPYATEPESTSVLGSVEPPAPCLPQPGTSILQELYFHMSMEERLSWWICMELWSFLQPWGVWVASFVLWHESPQALQGDNNRALCSQALSSHPCFSGPDPLASCVLWWFSSVLKSS